jgi:hypothetical protein
MRREITKIATVLPQLHCWWRRQKPTSFEVRSIKLPALNI